MKPDFIIIRHGGLAALASRLGVPAIPLGDASTAIGYQGMIDLGEEILAVMARNGFHQTIAAHATLPIGTRVRVTLHDNSARSVIVLINDRPGTRTRIIDLSREAAAKLGILERGVAMVTLAPL